MQGTSPTYDLCELFMYTKYCFNIFFPVLSNCTVETSVFKLTAIILSSCTSRRGQKGGIGRHSSRHAWQYIETAASVLELEVPQPLRLNFLQVFFLPNDFEPVTMGVILGKQNLRPRPGHICWKTYNAATKEALPFDNIGQNAPEFHEVCSSACSLHVQSMSAKHALQLCPCLHRETCLPSAFGGLAVAYTVPRTHLYALRLLVADCTACEKDP